MPLPREDRRFVTNDGIELTYSLWPGPHDDAAPVLLLHGLSQQRLFWGPVITRLRVGPIASLDQRGHGDSDTSVDADYSIEACANDVVGCLADLGWPRAVVVGHSWGGSVALRAAARFPDRVRAAVLIDGGLWSPAGLGDRAETRARLTPPRLGLTPDDLWTRIRSGELGTHWSEETQAALEPTFRTDGDGLLHSRLGLERHMLVLDGLLDSTPERDLADCAERGTPLWAAVCEDRGGAGSSSFKSAAVAAAEGVPNMLVHRWAGAIHDVPLQWPSLVAGFIETAVESSKEVGS